MHVYNFETSLNITGPSKVSRSLPDSHQVEELRDIIKRAFGVYRGSQRRMNDEILCNTDRLCVYILNLTIPSTETKYVINSLFGYKVFYSLEQRFPNFTGRGPFNPFYNARRATA
ncbi:hypothetical protein RF11_05659 [Thelohanellus kitauei]|uniref:Uncharacterized protein n=1 Tax=Thelohanellus kitauei TaxID=669202 RepID=A0A0C2ML54_THEKT|nr:hypothetical protein RF11_05659 [Thelohanellus kitauei]